MRKSASPPPSLPLTTLSIALLLSILTTTSSKSTPSSGSLQQDIATLLAFKKSSDPQTQTLITWNPNNKSHPSPCNTTTPSWLGVTCSSHRITRLVLENLNLTGPGLRILTQLTQLRVLSLKSNNLTGPIPDLTPLSALKLLFLSHNQFSGPIPASITNLTRLYRVDLSSNKLTGPVPAHLNRLTHLLTLRLESNRLTGSLSGLMLPRVQYLNVSYNRFTGQIPPALTVFPASAFSGNAALCGAPLQACADVISTPVTSSPATAAPETKPEVAAAGAGAGAAESGGGAAGGERKGGKMGRLAVALVVAGDFAALLAVSGLLFCYFWRKFGGKGVSRLREGEKIVYSSSPYAVAGDGEALTMSISRNLLVGVLIYSS